MKQQRFIDQSTKISELSPHIFRSFGLMRLRMKISFEACRQKKTIQELFLYAILKTYHERNHQGLIKNPYPKINKALIDAIKGNSLANLTEKCVLQKEAILMQKLKQ